MFVNGIEFILYLELEEILKIVLNFYYLSIFLWLSKYF